MLLPDRLLLTPFELAIEDEVVVGHALTVDERRAGFKDSSFHRCFNDGRLSLPAGSIRAYTVGLHRPNPVAREMPGFIGFFARRD